MAVGDKASVISIAAHLEKHCPPGLLKLLWMLLSWEPEVFGYQDIFSKAVPLKNLD